VFGIVKCYLDYDNQGGVIDNIMTMKKKLKFEFVYDSVFSSQDKEKVYIFKMLIKELASEVDLVKCMQSKSNL